MEKKWVRSTEVIRRVGYINDLEGTLGFDSSEPHTQNRHTKIDKKLQENAQKLLKSDVIRESDKEILKAYSLNYQSTYGNWRTGKRSVSKSSKHVFKLLFPEIEDKWFGIAPHKNRVGLYLDSIDLLESYLMGDESRSIELATKTLKLLLNDWTPLPNDKKYMRFDLCVPGPRINPNNSTMGFNLQREGYKFAEFELPKEAISLINQRAPETCTSYLYFLVGGGYVGDIDFRTDLTIDFLTSLNCGLLLYVHSKIHEDKTYSRIDDTFGSYLELLIHFFYDSTGFTDIFLDYNHLQGQTASAIQIHKNKNITSSGIRKRKDSKYAAATRKREAAYESTYAWKHVCRTALTYGLNNAFSKFMKDHKNELSKEYPKLFRGASSFQNGILNALFDSKYRFQNTMRISTNSKFFDYFSRSVNPLFGLLMEYNLINSQTKDKLNLKSTSNKIKKFSTK